MIKVLQLAIPLAACGCGIAYLYMLPTVIAHERRHHQRIPILILNGFLGWTFVGWVCALAWSASHVPPHVAEAPTPTWAKFYGKS
jgi:hypothetical protein